MKEEKTNRNERGELKQAAALKYDAQADSAPVIVGLGTGYVAERMMQEARAHDVPIVEDSQTAGILQHFALGEEIPPELYGVVAEILVFVAKLDGEDSRRYNIPKP